MLNKLFKEYLSSKKVEHGLVIIFDSIIPLVLCIFGATVQVSALVTLYFRFPISNVIEMYNPLTISIPSVSLCFFCDLTSYLANPNLQSTSPINGTQLRHKLAADELNLITPTYGQFVLDCSIFVERDGHSGDTKIVNCLNVTTPLTYINGFSKCFTLFRDTYESLTYSRSKYRNEFIMSMKLATRYARNSVVFISVHGNYENVSFETGSPGLVFLESGDENTFTLTFNAHRTTKKGPPYSECIHYLESTGRAKKDAIQQCMYDMIYTDYKSYSEMSYVKVPSRLRNLTFSAGIPMYKYRSKCEVIYHRPECEFELFELKLLRRFNTKGLPNETAWIRFTYPLGMQTSITTTNKLDDIEYFCYVASVINLWLEISLLTVAKFLFKNVRKFIPKFFRKLHQQQQQQSRPAESEFRNVYFNKVAIGKGLQTRSKVEPHYDGAYYRTKSRLRTDSYPIVAERDIKWRTRPSIFRKTTGLLSPVSSLENKYLTEPHLI